MFVSRLLPRANNLLAVDPSPADVAAALQAEGASDVHVGELVVGRAVAPGKLAGSQPSKDDASTTINEKAMHALDATPTPNELRQALLDARGSRCRSAS